MYSLLKNLHSYWAFLVLLVIILAIGNAFIGKIKGKDFESKDLRISLFGGTSLYKHYSHRPDYDGMVTSQKTK